MMMQDGLTAFIMAAARGHLAILGMLLQAGADAHVKSKVSALHIIA
jgi:ankyrin repeat protein